MRLLLLLVSWLQSRAPDALHPRKVDDDAPITDGLANDAMAATPDGDGKMLEAREIDRTNDVGTVSATANQGRIFVNHPVPHPTGAVVAIVVRENQFTVQMGPEVPKGHGVWSCIIHMSTPS